MNEASWTCKVCGKDNPNSYSFCSHCGTKRLEKAVWTCSNCGKPIFFDKFKYCIYCGAAKKKEEETVTATIEPARGYAEIRAPKVKVLEVSKHDSAEVKTLIKDISTFTLFCPSGYKMIRCVGHGGFCTVFEATDPKNNRVALKIPKIEMFDTSSAKIFEQIIREAEIWKKLSDKEKKERKELTIVEVFDYGKEPIPWISIEFMDGGSLHERLKDGPLNIKEALKISLRIADALHFAHHLGVVHLDVKPKNIMFNAKGEPKVTDWGLARVLLVESSRRGFEGTIICAAPEQLDSEKFGKPDWRTDIYGFGVTLYWMLSGRPPFYSNTLYECINMIISKEPTPLSKINASIPRELDEIVLELLAKRKEDRPEGIILVKKRIEEILQKAQ